MRTLKNLAIFVAGGMTMAYTLAWGMSRRTEYPLEDAVIYEDDNVKVTRVSTPDGGKKIDLATITYKHD